MSEGRWVVVVYEAGEIDLTKPVADQAAAVKEARWWIGKGWLAQIAGPLWTPEPDIGEAWDATEGVG